MDGFNVDRIWAGLRNPELYLKKLKQDSINQGGMNFNDTCSNTKSQFQYNSINNTILNNRLQMNQLAAIDRAVYIKTLLLLPQTLSAFLLNTQSATILPQNQSNLAGLNSELLKNNQVLAQLFDETDEINTDNILKQINQQNIQINTASKDAVLVLFNAMISIPDISRLILKNSKKAISTLITAMASASKNGMTNEQISETLKIINSCVSMAESNSPTQTIKSLMLLYLPWLPLNEGVGFDLEIEQNSENSEHTPSKLTVLIQTLNYGNVKGIFTLTTSNSVDILVLCSELFPKTLLLKSLSEEIRPLSVSTSIDVETSTIINKENDSVETKVNLSATNEINPYLLLLAHTFIRNVIYLDSITTLQ